MASGSVIRRVGWFALLVSLWPGVGMAQTVVFEGRVTDPLGGTINGAVVTLNSVGTTRTTRTGVDGTFSFDGVQAGSVSVSGNRPAAVLGRLRISSEPMISNRRRDRRKAPFRPRADGASHENNEASKGSPHSFLGSNSLKSGAYRRHCTPGSPLRSVMRAVTRAAISSSIALSSLPCCG